jgi:hypothetical protein
VSFTVYEIPLSANPQTFGITQSGVSYRMTLLYRDADQGGWVLDIADVNSQPIICGIPLVAGVDLLAQYRYLGFAGSLVVDSDGDPTAPPTFDNLGDTSHLWYVTVP